MRPPSRILASARILLDRTQRQLAADCGLTQKTVFRAENGNAEIETIEKLMRHYEDKGIVFTRPAGNKGWGIRTNFLKDDYDRELKAKKAESES